LPETSLGNSSRIATRERPALEDWSVVQARIAEIRDRESLLRLADTETTQRLLEERKLDPDLSKLNWVRLLSTLPKSGSERIVAINDIKSKGTLDPRSKAVIAYVAARHDRSWYALGHAIHQWRSLGFSDSQIQQLDSPSTASSSVDAALIRFSQIITTDPALITDRDFQNMQNHMSDKQVAEAVYITTQAAFFDRITEVCLLPLE
jgi:alkylhydroperoxidase family enzyme